MVAIVHTPHSVQGRKFSCGPAAISAVTGKSVEALALDRTKSMSSYQLTQILKHEGFRVTDLKVPFETYKRNRPCRWFHHTHEGELVTKNATVARFLRERTPEQRRSIIVIVLRDHFLVAHLDTIYDNGNRNGIDAIDYRRRRACVYEAVLVTRRQA